MLPFLRPFHLGKKGGGPIITLVNHVFDLCFSAPSETAPHACRAGPYSNARAHSRSRIALKSTVAQVAERLEEGCERFAVEWQEPCPVCDGGRTFSALFDPPTALGGAPAAAWSAAPAMARTFACHDRSLHGVDVGDPASRQPRAATCLPPFRSVASLNTFLRKCTSAKTHFCENAFSENAFLRKCIFAKMQFEKMRSCENSLRRKRTHRPPSPVSRHPSAAIRRSQAAPSLRCERPMQHPSPDSHTGRGGAQLAGIALR